MGRLQSAKRNFCRNDSKTTLEMNKYFFCCLSLIIFAFVSHYTENCPLYYSSVVLTKCSKQSFQACESFTYICVGIQDDINILQPSTLLWLESVGFDYQFLTNLCRHELSDIIINSFFCLYLWIMRLKANLHDT